MTKKQITAKFDSECPACLSAICAGDKVMWGPGLKATHLGECSEYTFSAAKQAKGRYAYIGSGIYARFAA